MHRPFAQKQDIYSAAKLFILLVAVAISYFLSFDWLIYCTFCLSYLSAMRTNMELDDSEKASRY